MAEDLPSWRWRKGAAASILVFCGVASLLCLLKGVSDEKASTMIIASFTLAGSVYGAFVAGKVTHDISAAATPPESKGPTP